MGESAIKNQSFTNPVGATYTLPPDCVALPLHTENHSFRFYVHQTPDIQNTVSPPHLCASLYATFHSASF